MGGGGGVEGGGGGGGGTGGGGGVSWGGEAGASPIIILRRRSLHRPLTRGGVGEGNGVWGVATHWHPPLDRPAGLVYLGLLNLSHTPGIALASDTFNTIKKRKRIEPN